MCYDYSFSVETKLLAMRKALPGTEINKDVHLWVSSISTFQMCWDEVCLWKRKVREEEGEKPLQAKWLITLLQIPFPCTSVSASATREDAHPAGQREGPTRRSTMLGLLFLSVFTAWKTSTVLWCRSISQTMLMAQNVPLRPPPFLSEEKSDGWTTFALRWHCSHNLWRCRPHPREPGTVKLSEARNSWPGPVLLIKANGGNEPQRWAHRSLDGRRQEAGTPCSPSSASALDYVNWNSTLSIFIARAHHESFSMNRHII